jgi:hypothetical protein
LLEGELAERALGSVQEIASALLADSPASRDPSLARGAAGWALLFGYLARAGHASTGAEVRLLEQAVEGLAEAPLAPTFMSGFAGVAWAAEHLTRDPDQDIDQAGNDDINADIDEALQAALNGDQLIAHDHIDGLVGVGVYFLERWPRPAAVRALETLLRILAERAERHAAGSTWWTPPGRLPPSVRQRYPEGHYNLGLAHGVPGAVVFLARCRALGVDVPRAAGLLESSAAWLLSKRMPPGSTSVYGLHVLPGQGVEPTAARASWCYGDPGMAAALWQAGRSAGQAAWCEEALTLMRAVARRPPADCDVSEPGLCHGAAGLGHLLNRGYQETGDPAVGRAARDWFERALAMRRPGSGVAGFHALAPGGPGTLVPVADPGLLNGAAGVALALLAAASEVEPAWDRALLLSGRAS